MAVGRFAEAERAARTAADLEPFSLIGRSVLLRVLALGRRWRAIIAEARSVLDRAPRRRKRGRPRAGRITISAKSAKPSRPSSKA